MREAYPLGALLQLRENEVAAAERALAQAQHALSRAEADSGHRSEALRLHEEATRTSLSQPTSAADALTLHAWRNRRREEARELQDHIALARRTQAACEQALSAAQETLRGALAQRQAITEHHARWLRGVEYEDAQREEHEMDERRR